MTKSLNLSPDATMITDATLRLFYDKLTTADAIRDYFADEMMIFDLDITDRDALIRAIDTDLNDMIHNNNLDFYLPLADLDTLDEPTFIALADHLSATTDPAMIADALLARLNATTP